MTKLYIDKSNCGANRFKPQWMDSFNVQVTMNNGIGKLRSELTMRLLVLATLCLGSMTLGQAAIAQVGDGLTPAVDSTRAFGDGTIVRDSGIDQPLNLLNDFYPAVQVSLSSHDNIRRRSDLDEEDTRIRITPSLGYKTNLGRHKFYAAYSGVFTFHDELDDEDSQSNRVVAELGLDISRRWDINLRGGFGETFEERGVSGSRPFNQFIPDVDSGPDEADFGFYGVDLVYGAKFSPLVAILGYNKRTLGYENNFQGIENITGGRDREAEAVRLDLSYRIGARTAVFGRIREGEVDYDRALNSLDSEQTDYLIGLRWKPTNKLSGVVGVGQTEREYEDPSRDDYEGSSYYANLNYAFSPFSSFQLNASRSVEEPGDDLSDFYVSDFFGVGWRYGISSNLRFNAFAKWIDDDYNTERTDEFFDYRLGLDYAFRSWLTAGIYFGEVERESNVAGLDYEDSYFGIRIRTDLRPLLKGRSEKSEPYEYPRPSDIR